MTPPGGPNRKPPAANPRVTKPLTAKPRPAKPPTAAAHRAAASANGISSLGSALSQLFALKGYAADRGNAQLVEAWKALAGERIASRTAVLGVNRGVLQVGVSSAAMLGELASFHKDRLVADLKAKHPALKLRDIKFRLRGDLAKPSEEAGKSRE